MQLWSFCNANVVVLHSKWSTFDLQLCKRIRDAALSIFFYLFTFAA